MNIKEACQKIRYICKRGNNETLQRIVQEVYAAGMEAGARILSEKLKGRINDYQQSTNNGSDIVRIGGESDSTEPSESRGPDAVDSDRA